MHNLHVATDKVKETSFGLSHDAIAQANVDLVGKLHAMCPSQEWDKVYFSAVSVTH